MGAALACRSRQSRDGRRPSEDIEADPGASVPAASGVEPYSGAALDGRRRRDTNRRPELVSERVRRTDVDHAERRTAAAPWITESTWSITNTTIPASTRPRSVCEGSTTRVMNPLSCGDGTPFNTSGPLQTHDR